jgi:hypothetical protein
MVRAARPGAAAAVCALQAAEADGRGRGGHGHVAGAAARVDDLAARVWLSSGGTGGLCTFQVVSALASGPLAGVIP